MPRTLEEARALIHAGTLARTVQRNRRHEPVRCVRVGDRFVPLPAGAAIPATRDAAEALAATGVTARYVTPPHWTCVAEFDDPPAPTRAVRVVSGRYRDRVSYLLIPEAVPAAVLAEADARALVAIAGVEPVGYLPDGVTVVRTLRRGG